MPDLIQFEEQLLAHDLQSAYLTRVLLLRKVYLSVSTLSDLGQDLEVALTQSGAAFTQVCTLATEIPIQRRLIFFDRGRGRGRIGGLELGLAVLAVVDIAEQVKVIIEEI